MKNDGNEYYESLFLRMLGEGVSAEEYEELEAWFDASEENRTALVELYRVHHAMRSVGSMEKSDPVGALRRLDQALRGRKRLGRAAIGVAAVAIAGVFLGIFFWGSDGGGGETLAVSDVTLVMPDNRTLTFEGREPAIEHGKGGFTMADSTPQAEVEPMVRLIVPKGKRSSLRLPDGTVMWVNSDSRVSFPARAGARREVCVDGEVYLEVAHDEARPFTVRTRNFEATVLGTSFNVNAYDRNDVQNLALVEGSVRVLSADKSVVTLRPCQMLACGSEGVVVSEVEAMDHMSWITGVYRFRSERLREIADRVEHYYGVPIVFEVDSLAERRFSGRLEFRDDADFVYESIALAVGLEYTLLDDRVEFSER